MRFARAHVAHVRDMKVSCLMLNIQACLLPNPLVKCSRVPSPQRDCESPAVAQMETENWKSRVNVYRDSLYGKPPKSRW